MVGSMNVEGCLYFREIVYSRAKGWYMEAMIMCHFWCNVKYFAAEGYYGMVIYGSYCHVPNFRCNVTYFEAVGSFGMVLHDSSNHVPILGVMYGIGSYYMVWYGVAWH